MPIGYEVSLRLFKRGVAYLQTRDRLAAAVRWGMSQSLWRQLLAEMIAQAEPLLAHRIVARDMFTRDRPPDPETIIDLVEFAIRGQRAVILLIRGEYSHFTVVSGISDTRLLLHDSFGLKWLGKQAADRTKAVGKRWIAAESITMIELGDPVTRPIVLPAASSTTKKAAAIDEIWDNRHDLHAAYLADPDKLTFCAELPFIGEITRYHLAKDLGLDVAKPDIHLARLARAEGVTAQELCLRHAHEAGCRVSTVDTILWRACAEGIRDSELYLERGWSAECLHLPVDGLLYGNG
ncbi:hypothetical protein PQ455_04755 [Sphingomonas naphthae]|uniref:Uncharacterized protein n=1 Tax=Sphingomonas naphthae TaxID=1813468 RepID=A0ABY7TQA8_9SPHN|nr:hypothetical protein [Sphingomonas naphthae]WCT74545.1 hypothetical protein PQ455_04755 [Sphingomonas naphthae]